ncbi:MAG: GCN5-related N-acetyltransferase [Frondihabitans sp.]|nr:GCN5-related N-acetyltransferase [Frondihabitans sp.]
MIEVPVAVTYPLRERLLRHDREDLDLHMADDDVPGAFHLAVLDPPSTPIGVASLVPTPPSFAVALPAWRLRQMAVHPDFQHSGIGSVILNDAIARLRHLGAATLWAESRDTSLEFYVGHGMTPVPGRHHTTGTVSYTDVVLPLALLALPKP